MKLCVALFCCCSTILLNAQSSIDLFTISGFYGPPSNYETPLSGEGNESGGLVNLKIPVVLNEKTVWYSDLTYTLYAINTDLSPEPPGMLTSMQLNAFIFQTGVAHKLNDRNGFQLLAVPRYTTDFKGSDSKSWQFGMVGLYEHRYSEKLLMRFGVLYNGELFGPLMVPLVYLDWQMSDRWSMVGLAPINLKISYKVNDKLSAGYAHFGFITTYRIGQQEFKTDYVERNSIDESLFLRWKMAGNLYLETRLGYSLGRIYAQYAEDQKMDFRLSILSFGDDRIQKNVNFDSGPIASFRLVYNLPLD